MQAAYVKTPMEYWIDQTVDFVPTIYWNLVASFDEYRLINVTFAPSGRHPQGHLPNSQIIAVTVNATDFLKVAD
jgi:hypothetical protein